ncbi:perilipin-3-like [Trachemys scripta elegans]|uniref:perilipin-3-like n=1 Tax=Trachemys scripta elegans TaxID=31138 RepID=UPI001553054C|nr:perilipin-3-like [Trachemys scripta elegans]XP_034643402.1 perilipin-3-like [Trachemys scripta elegans]XP_034643403.1 perilipin-3-like [Trachemys scripta elegans]
MSDESQTTAPAPDSKEQQTPASQVAGLPLFKSTYDMVVSALTSAKGTQPSVKSVCEAAEKGVTAMAGEAVTSAQPALTDLEPQLAIANEGGCKGLEKLEEKLPVKELADKDLSEPKELVSSEEVDAVSSRMTEVVDVTKETLQDRIEAVKSMVTSSMSTVMGSTVGQMAMSGVEAVLEKSEDLVDHYLPITDEELASLAESVEGAEESAVQHHGYFVRLGSLSAQLRQRAYQHSLGKVRQAKQGMQQTFLQFHEVLDLINSIRQNVDQKLQDGQQKLHQMWLDWSSKQPEESNDAASTEPKQVESHTLAMSQSITQQLQDDCQTLKASIQGLPSSLQEKVQQVLKNLEELHNSFFAAKSFHDLPSATQSQEKITKSQEYIDELLEYIEHNTPFSWLVGPFTPSGRAYVTPQEEPEKEEVAQKKAD